VIIEGFDEPPFRGASPAYYSPGTGAAISPFSTSVEGPNPPCGCCSRNLQCAFFYGQVVFSFLILCVSVVGLAGLIGDEDGCFNNSFYSNLITMVVALWIGRSTGGVKAVDQHGV
jgi:hypothetical protein